MTTNTAVRIFSAATIIATLLGSTGANAAITPTLLTNTGPFGNGTNDPLNAATVNLSTVGTTDWVAFGGNGNTTPVRKATGGSQIGGATRISGDGIAFAANINGAPALSWSGGSLVASASGNRDGILNNNSFGFGQGLQFDTLCTGGNQTLTVYTGAGNAAYQLSAQLFTGATPSGAAVTTAGTGFGYREGYGVIQYDFSGTAGQVLRFSVTTTSKIGDFSGTEARLYGAALSNAAAVPEAGAGLFFATGAVALVAARRRR